MFHLDVRGMLLSVTSAKVTNLTPKVGTTTALPKGAAGQYHRSTDLVNPCLEEAVTQTQPKTRN